MMNKNNNEIVLAGLDGSNPLAFLAALGTMRTLTNALPAIAVKMAWTQHGGHWSPVISLNRSFDEKELTQLLFDHLEKDIQKHPVAFMESLKGAAPDHVYQLFRHRSDHAELNNKNELDWLSAMSADLAPEATSQLQTARRDYFFGNMKNVMHLTEFDHLFRTLFQTWDYGDSLENQSLHLEPSEDRRHAHQWYKPSGDPNRKKQGGMLGANCLAIEAFTLFQSIAVGDKLSTRGFSGNRADNTWWTWPLWSCPLDLDTIGSLLGLYALQTINPLTVELRARGIEMVFRSQRILVGKTPNLTPAESI